MESTFYNGKIWTLAEFYEAFMNQISVVTLARELAWRFPYTSKDLVELLLGEATPKHKRKNRK